MAQQSGRAGPARYSIQRFWKAADSLLRAILLPRHARLNVWVGYVLLLGLFLLGIFHWVYFLNYGRLTFDMHDWVQEGWRYAFLREAVLARQLPLHVSTPFTDLDRFIARPDTVLSPQVLLLNFLDLGPFVLVNTLLLYSAGFAGLLLLKKRFDLSGLSFTALFLLFNFNGHITAHLAVGHSMYVGYFLLPFFVYLVLELVDGEQVGWKWVMQLSVLLFILFLQGAFHQFIWCLMFLLLLALFQPRYARPLLKALLFSLLLSLPRILPPAFEFADEGMNFISGFPTVADLFAGLVVLKHPVEALSGPYSSLGWWEIDHYVGLLGFAFLVYFGIYLTWKLEAKKRVLLAPGAAMAFLSVGYMYYLVNRLPIPLTDSERVTTRFLILPLVFLFVLGAIRLEAFLRSRARHGPQLLALSLGLLALAAHDLFQHSRLWRFTNMVQLFPNTPVQLIVELVQRPDPLYFMALWGGGGVALLAFLYLLVKVRQESAKISLHGEKELPCC
jgi:hypothetical protein